MSGVGYSVDPSQVANERVGLLEKRALFSALWLFYLLNLIFRDLHEIVKAEVLEELQTGIYNGQEVTEALFLVGGVLVEIPILMTLLAWVLPAQIVRRANIALAPVFGLIVVISLPGDLDDYFHASMELAALAVITWQALKWKPTSGAQSASQR